MSCSGCPPCPSRSPGRGTGCPLSCSFRKHPSKVQPGFHHSSNKQCRKYFPTATPLCKWLWDLLGTGALCVGNQRDAGTAGGLVMGPAPTASPEDARQKRYTITVPPSCSYGAFLLAALQPATASAFLVLIQSGTSLPVWVPLCLSTVSQSPVSLANISVDASTAGLRQHHPWVPQDSVALSSGYEHGFRQPQNGKTEISYPKAPLAGLSILRE